MSPIPINASTGMLISLAVAFIVTPWLALHLLKSHHNASSAPEHKATLLLRRILSSFLSGDNAKKARRKLALVVGLLVLGSLALPVVELVVLKMLPFDNKSEFQVMVDLPEGTPLEHRL
jgi:multidrug efflux pump subunit AcrB